MKKVGFKRFVSLIAAVSSAVFVCSCTEPGETTAVGAATGGVIGAGLGAIVGSQTGNAGSGLVVGAAAGAGTGAMIANALQAQEETLRVQDEAIERQEQVIRSQKSEIDELRRMNQMGDYSRPVSRQGVVKPQARSDASMAVSMNSGDQSLNDSRVTASSRPGLSEKTVQSGSRPAAAAARERASYNWDGGNSGKTPGSDAEAKKMNNGSGTNECIEAQGEVTKANGLQDPADKLFHLRRALRLCPNNAMYHNSLGELYLTLNRRDDAKFEFDEALRLEPGNRQAQANIEYMKTK